MNTFFCNVGENLSKDIPTRFYPFRDETLEMPNQDAPFHFSPITCEKLVATLGNIKVPMDMELITPPTTF